MKNIDIQFIHPDDFYLSKLFKEGSNLKKVKINNESWLFSGIWIDEMNLTASNLKVFGGKFTIHNCGV